MRVGRCASCSISESIERVSYSTSSTSSASHEAKRCAQPNGRVLSLVPFSFNSFLRSFLPSCPRSLLPSPLTYVYGTTHVGNLDGGEARSEERGRNRGSRAGPAAATPHRRFSQCEYVNVNPAGPCAHHAGVFDPLRSTLRFVTKRSDGMYARGSLFSLFSFCRAPRVHISGPPPPPRFPAPLILTSCPCIDISWLSSFLPQSVFVLHPCALFLPLSLSTESLASFRFVRSFLPSIPRRIFFC